MELPEITEKSRIGDFIPLKWKYCLKESNGFIIGTDRQWRLKRLKNFK